MTDVKYSSSAPVCACGKLIIQRAGPGRPRKYCCVECSNIAKVAARETDNRPRGYVRVSVRTFECIQCGGQFDASHAKRYCSSYCRNRAKHLKHRPHAPSRGPSPYIALRQCAGCGEMFKPRRSVYGTYCTRECAFEMRAAAPVCYVWTGYCLGCGDPFVSRRKRSYCGDACRPSHAYKYVSTAPERKVCRRCGQSFKTLVCGGRPGEFCSSVCRMLSVQATKRTGKAKRRALLRLSTVENVDPFRVFERDRWTCQLCGVRTPKSKRGTYDDDAPELDHIVPLAKFGAHSYLNVQCACRKCNREKSDKARGQLLLIG